MLCEKKARMQDDVYHPKKRTRVEPCEIVEPILPYEIPSFSMLLECLKLYFSSNEVYVLTYEPLRKLVCDYAYARDSDENMVWKWLFEHRVFTTFGGYNIKITWMFDLVESQKTIAWTDDIEFNPNFQVRCGVIGSEFNSSMFIIVTIAQLTKWIYDTSLCRPVFTNVEVVNNAIVPLFIHFLNDLHHDISSNKMIH
jgi:hypothetical protein